MGQFDRDAGAVFFLENAVTDYFFEGKFVTEEACLQGPGGEQRHRLPLQDRLPAFGNPKIEDRVCRGQ